VAHTFCCLRELHQSVLSEGNRHGSFCPCTQGKLAQNVAAPILAFTAKATKRPPRPYRFNNLRNGGGRSYTGAVARTSPPETFATSRISCFIVLFTGARVRAIELLGPYGASGF
jgi:hypothetical protein